MRRFINFYIIAILLHMAYGCDDATLEATEVISESSPIKLTQSIKEDPKEFTKLLTESIVMPILGANKSVESSKSVIPPKEIKLTTPIIKPIVAKYVYDKTIKPSDVKRYIPDRANQYLPIVKKEATRLMPDLPFPYYFGGLIEHESCISVTHSRCWSPTSRLKSAREEGAGLGMITKAFNSDGSIRFDSLTAMRKAHQVELKEMSWNNIYSRPDLQIRTMVLMVRNDYKSLYTVKDSYQRLAMSDAAYNGGLGGFNKERRQCGLTKGCDPQSWFGHIEKVCLKSKKPIYGNRSACDINRGHPQDVLVNRMPKYRPYF